MLDTKGKIAEIKVTFKQVREFNIAVDGYFARDKAAEFTKLGYAIKRISEVQIKNILQEYQKEWQDVKYENVDKKQVEYALSDKVTGAVLTSAPGSARPYLYDKAGLQAVMQAERAFGPIAEKLLEEWDLREFDLKPYIATEIPKDLKSSEIEAFSSFVIDAKDADKMLKAVGSAPKAATGEEMPNTAAVVEKTMKAPAK